MATGYVRLSLADMRDIRLVHLISGLDEDTPQLAANGAVSTAITGYTEWITEGTPVLTVGWDWQMLAGADGIRLRRASEPRSNVMMVDSANDAGPLRTAAMLEDLIDAFDWQGKTLQHINIRYHS